MSAYMVSAAHIDVLVAGAKQYTGPGNWSFYTWPGLVRCEFSRFFSDDESDDMRFNPDSMGRELWAENLRSINARYPDTIDNPGDTPGAGDFADVLAYQYGPGARVVDVDPLGLLGAIRGYRYQACETGEAFYASASEAFCRGLESAVVDRLIDVTGASAWSLDSVSGVSGELHATSGDDGSWTLRFVPGESGAVSITDMIARGRK